MSALPPARPAVVWDMGGILYRYFTEVLLDRAASEGWHVHGVPLGPTGRTPDPDYDAMNAGDIGEGQYLAVVRQRLAAVGVEVDPVAEIDWSHQTRPSAWHLIDALHDAGHPQALLTNDATTWLGSRWWETWPATDRFDAIVDVVEVGVRKPAPEPYLAAADALGLDPSACLFVDDLMVNCAGAQAVGMASHHVDVHDADRSLERLAVRLGLEVELSDPTGPASPR